MDRVLQNTPATISETWYQGDAIADPGAVTVTVTRDDGTQLATGSAAPGTSPLPTQARTFQLTATHTSLLDYLTVTWQSATLGSLTTRIEVVGDFLFTIADMRKRLPDATLYPSDDIAAARTWAETEIENACGIAFVPRYGRETLNGSGAQRLEPKWPRIRTLRGAVVDGVPMSTADLAGVVVELERFLTRPYGYWRPWVSNVLIRYEHGLDSPPPGITAAAIELARYKLINDAGQATIDPRADRVITEDGTITLGLAGINGRFGIPTVDAAIDAWSELAVY